MSPVAHSLVGLTLGNLAGQGSRRRGWFLVAGVALANLPDWPLPGWGHDAYHVSHSLAVNLTLIGLAALVGRRWLGASSLAALALAWLSHLLLDSLYRHGKGVAIGWPLTDFRLALPIPWLQTLDVERPFGWRNVSVALLELATFAPLVLLWRWPVKAR